MNGASLLPEFDHELQQTRKTLERVPTDRFDWKPHAKSMSLRELASHLADLPHWLPMTLESAELDLDESGYEPFSAESLQGLLGHFDDGVRAARSALEEATEQRMGETWTMKAGGEVAFSMPKAAVVRSFILNHNVHHRAQLGVYLRLLDLPVPAVYGPSADEQG